MGFVLLLSKAGLYASLKVERRTKNTVSTVMDGSLVSALRVAHLVNNKCTLVVQIASFAVL